MSTPDSPGARLRTLRQHLGLTGQALGKELAVTKTAVSYWEGDRVALPQSIALALEQIFGVSAHWLLEGKDPMWGSKWTASLPALPEGLVRVALLDPARGFNRRGEAQLPGPHAPSLCFPETLLRALTSPKGDSWDHLHLWAVSDEEMSPSLRAGDWVLLDTSKEVRRDISDHEVYLIRTQPGDAPVLRRVAKDPLSGDLILAVDVPGRVPMRLPPAARRLEELVLGHAVWAGGRVT